MNELTLQRLKQMKFQGMATAFKTTLEDGRIVLISQGNLCANEIKNYSYHLGKQTKKITL